MVSAANINVPPDFRLNNSSWESVASRLMIVYSSKSGKVESDSVFLTSIFCIRLKAISAIFLLS